MSENWGKEERIFEFCENHARRIIAELQTSGGEHYQDIQILDGLIEGWELLRFGAEEDRLNEEYARRKK